MRLRTLPGLVLACLVALPGRARADEFADFRIPSHQVISWTGSLDGWGRRSTADFATSRQLSGDLFGVTGTDFRRLADGEDGLTDLFLSAFLRGDRSNSKTSLDEQFPSLTRHSDSRYSTRSTSERWEVRVSFGRYVGRAPIAFGADVRALGGLDQGWNDSRNTGVDIDPVSTYEQWSESDGRSRRTFTIASLRPRVGLGRVRDATGVFTARMIEERLRRDGVLTRPLTHDARQALADLLALRQPYGNLHARPAKGLWAEIERIVRDDGALAPGGLDAASTQHAGEPLLDGVSFGRPADGLPGTIVLRLRGVRAGVFVSGAHQRESMFRENGSASQLTVNGVPQPIFSSRSSQDETASTDAVDAGLEAEWHRPVGLRVQLDASAAASVPLRSQDDGLFVVMNGDASWLVADRWLVQASVDQQRDLRQDANGGSTRQDDWRFVLGGQVSFAIEDNVTIQLRVQDLQLGERLPGVVPFAWQRYAREQTVVLGFTYRFAGRFTAPGFESLSRWPRPAPGF